MKIELHEIPIAEVVNGYVDSAEDGVVAYCGKLNVRPAYQREFIYKDKQRDEVINTIRKGFPLNVMYWVKGESGNYEVLDGQQRTISFCQYVTGEYSINYQYFHNLEEDEKKQILYNIRCVAFRFIPCLFVALCYTTCRKFCATSA